VEIIQRIGLEEKRSRMKRMEPIRNPKILARATAAFDLCQATEDMYRQKLRRQHPQASEEEIRQRFMAWLEDRPYTEPQAEARAELKAPIDY
jgi:Rv0078B-related antitoxin